MLKQIITCILRLLRKAHGLLQVLTSCVMMPCSNKPIRMLMDLSLVFLNSVMFLFVKFSSAVQRYCCSRCTLLNFFLLTHSRKCVNLYIMNIDTRLTCWDMEILIWCLAATFWNRKLLFSKTMVNKASWMHWITKAETCSILTLWCTLFSLYKMQKMYEVYVHLWAIYLCAVL